MALLRLVWQASFTVAVDDVVVVFVVAVHTVLEVPRDQPTYVVCVCLR